ncbi:hypothetical protein GJ629_12335 [Halapricum sp. CBA1109]|uniref:DUF7510 family protein n=1 Tax=Halapricum sp. CBA1109 TaxID=2668068 RepID=UPI0012F7E029|nr:hypothetical protein [Halapricum sp. CBA1109]MUV90591.1 hypothetical protein [Halapricum sp. CBA1109]
MSDGLTFEMRTVEGRTILDFEGRRSVAVVVQSDDDEEIYLPHARSGDRGGPPSSYQPADEDDSTGPPSSYQPSDEDNTGPPSSYQPAPAADAATGRSATSGGFRIVHPDPVTDVRVIGE